MAKQNNTAILAASGLLIVGGIWWFSQRKKSSGSVDKDVTCMMELSDSIGLIDVAARLKDSSDGCAEAVQRYVELYQLDAYARAVLDNSMTMDQAAAGFIIDENKVATRLPNGSISKTLSEIAGDPVVLALEELKGRMHTIGTSGVGHFLMT
jgi:hypothetical protein